MREAKLTIPARPLLGHKRGRYIPAQDTDIRITLEKFRRLMRLKERANAS